MDAEALDNSPQAILQRIDRIRQELLTLRQLVKSLIQEEPTTDLVTALAGSVGPAAPGEAEYFNTFDVTWQRFTEA